MTPEPLESVALTPFQTFPFDRAYAIENGPGPFDPANPRHLPKIHFVMLMRNEELAALHSRFNDRTHMLSISKEGVEIARGDLRTVEGRTEIEDVVLRQITSGLRGRPRIVSSPGHNFTDVAAKCVHVINLASVRALETMLGAKVDPRRFRPNIVVDGLAPWSELQLLGKRMSTGGVTLEVFKRTERCAATNVDPETGTRAGDIPTFLLKSFGNADFGVYARVLGGGRISPGDTFHITD
jgi:uncharacterized protein YcbX